METCPRLSVASPCAGEGAGACWREIKGSGRAAVQASARLGGCGEGISSQAAAISLGPASGCPSSAQPGRWLETVSPCAQTPLGKSNHPVGSKISQPKQEGKQLPRTVGSSAHFQAWAPCPAMDAWLRCPSALGGARSAAHKTDAGGRAHEQPGPQVGAVLAPMVLEAPVPQQSPGPMEAELSPTSRGGTADSYAAPKASGEAGLAQAPRHGPSQIASPLPRAKGRRQASRHRQARGIQCWGPSQRPTPCAMPSAKGTSDLNPNHPRAGSCMPETASQGQNHPKEKQHPSGQIFPYHHTQLVLKQQHQSCRGRARQLQDLHPAAQGGSPSPISLCAGCSSLPSEQGQGASAPLPSCRSPPCLLQALSAGRGSVHPHGFSRSQRSGAPLTHRGFRVPPHKQCEITLTRNNHSPQPRALQEGERGDAGNGSRGEREVLVILRGLNVLDPC